MALGEHWKASRFWRVGSWGELGLGLWARLRGGGFGDLFGFRASGSFEG